MRKKFKYDSPEIILIVSKEKTNSVYEKIFQCGLDQIDKPYVALSIAVKPAHLKNMLKVFRLMDVTGVFITADLAKQSNKFADVAPKKGPINTVVLKKGKYHGQLLNDSDLQKLVADNIKFWTGKKVDPKKLKRALSRIEKLLSF